MAFKLNVGLSKKVGLPNYGSLGASCHVEIKLDPSLLVTDLETLQRRIRQAYAVCEEAVDDELARGQPSNSHRSDCAVAVANNGTAPPVNGHGTTPQESPAGKQRATERQLNYARQLAAQIPEIGLRRLEQFTVRVCGKHLADVTATEASQLIDALKGVKEGRLEMQLVSPEVDG